MTGLNEELRAITGTALTTLERYDLPDDAAVAIREALICLDARVCVLEGIASMNREQKP
jgi:hypothetical protein